MALRKLTSSLRSHGPKRDEEIVWSKQGVLDLKEKVKVKASRMYPHQEPPRVLFIGETGSGKSSFISSVMSALSGDVTYASMIGEWQGCEENTSKRYLEYRVFMGENPEPLNFILCDARGLGKKNQLGMANREIERLMDGKLRHDDLIESEKGSDGTLIDNRDPKPPSCVVFVQRASRLGEVDRDVQDKLNKAADIARSRGISCCVVLTHIDLVKPSLPKKLHTALKSRTLLERVQRAAREVGVNTNRVFLVKNYTNEERTHVRHDILILRALHGILVDLSARHRFGYMGPDRGSSYQHASPMSSGSLDESDFSSVSMSTADSRPSTSVSMQSSRPTQPTYHHQERYRSDPYTEKRRSLVESDVSSGYVSTADSGLSTSVSMQGSGPTQLTYHHHERYGSDPHPEKLTEETPPKAKDFSTSTVEEIRRIPRLMKRGQDYVGYIIPKNQSWEKVYEGSDSDVEYDPEEEGSESDKGELGTDMDSDESMAGKSATSSSSSEDEYGVSCSSLLKNTIQALGDRQFPEQYKEKANLWGAKPLFQPTILQLNHSSLLSTDTEGGRLCLQLPKTFRGDGNFHQRVQETLKEALCSGDRGAGTPSGSLWMSYTLPADLGLPMDVLPPASTDLQAFFLAPGHPPLLLTFFDAVKNPGHRSSSGEILHRDADDALGRELQQLTLFVHEEPLGVGGEITTMPAVKYSSTMSEAEQQSFPGGVSRTSGKSRDDHLTAAEREREVEQVRLHTLQLGKFLTTALLDFCCCDFVLLPCCLSAGDLTPDRLLEEVRQQRRLASRFYGGPLDLGLSAYRELKAAAVAVTGVSHVPCLMSARAPLPGRPRMQQEEEEEDTAGQGMSEDQDLVLMDPDWRAAVSLLVETLTGFSDYSELAYPASSGFKSQVAVLEAARRLSFTDHVLLLTPSTRMQDVCREMAKQAFDDTGVTLKLKALPPSGVVCPDDVTLPTCVILLDCPSGFKYDKGDYIILRVSQVPEKWKVEGRGPLTPMATSKEWV